VVGESGANLYARQDDESEIIAKLEGREELIPLAQAVERESWYMVQTQKGAVGWVKSSDVRTSEQVEKVFKEIRSNTWSARTSTGREFSGTWSGEADPSTGAVSGTWTLSDGKGATIMGGTWSGNKSLKGWSGAWRAVVGGRRDEYSGTWTADTRLAPEARLADLFEAAVQDVVGGSYRAGAQSGSWFIRAAK
jgi:hypothetical protein